MVPFLTSKIYCFKTSQMQMYWRSDNILKYPPKIANVIYLNNLCQKAKTLLNFVAIGF